MATITVTHTKTYALMDAWASTLPWECLIRDTGCCSPTHNHTPMADDPCAVDDCDQSLLPRQECYAVTQLERDENGREQWVCWRHVRPDGGPITVDKSP